MPKVIRSSFFYYGAAVVAVALALPLTQLLWPLIAPSALPLFFAAVMLVSWYGGLGPGLLATALSTLAISYYFTPLHYSAITSLEDIGRPGIFTLVALLTVWLNEASRRSEKRREKRAGQQIARAEQERRRVEEEFRREREFYERLIDNNGDGFFAFDRDCRNIVWNKGMERISGISRSEALGKSAFDLFPSLKNSGELEHFLEALQGKSSLSLDIPHVFPTGREGFIDIRYWPLREGAGEIIGGLAVVYDITERKRIEEERMRLVREEAERLDAEAAERRSLLLAEVSSALASSNDYQATLAAVASLLVSQIADWCIFDIVEMDGSFRRLAVAHQNPSRAGLSLEVERLYSLEPQSDSKTLYGPLLALREGRLDMVCEISDSWLAAVARDANHLKNLQQLGLKSHICLPLLARGRTLGAISLLLAETGRRYSRVDLSLAEDIARHCAMAVDNARLYEELKEANRYKDKFLATFSHELRAPLTFLDS